MKDGFLLGPRKYRYVKCPAWRVPLRVWFLGIFFVARHKKGISARQFQRKTGVGSYQTAWTLLHKLRSCVPASRPIRFDA